MSDNKKIGQRRTHQREILVEIIKKSVGPLSVNEIHELAEKAGHKIGIATVYRTIKLLLESKIIESVTLPDGQARYEAAELGHHHHFHCSSCGKVIDIDNCCMHLHDKEVEGHLIESHEITLFGICKGCR